MARITSSNYRKRPRRGVKVRRLDLKFRVRPLRRMPKSLLFAKLKSFVETGDLPEDIEVSAVSYDRKYGKTFTPGRIDPDDWEELRKFYRVLANAQSVRVELARKGRVRRGEA